MFLVSEAAKEGSGGGGGNNAETTVLVFVSVSDLSLLCNVFEVNGMDGGNGFEVDLSLAFKAASIAAVEDLCVVAVEALLAVTDFPCASKRA